MIARKRKRAGGKTYTLYMYNGRDENGNRKEISLGTDLNEAKRKWADLDCSPIPVDAKLMGPLFDRYIRDILPKKAPSTQRENMLCLTQLRPVFDQAPVDAIQPAAIASYRDARSAPVRANREIALLSHVFNMAREWGVTNAENPCKGVRKNKEKPRDYYAEQDVWDAVYSAGVAELQEAMDMAYLTGQRPADVLAMGERRIRNDELHVRQGKTSQVLRIRMTVDGNRTKLGQLVDRLLAKPVRPLSGELLCTEAGVPLSAKMIRDRFEDARTSAADKATESHNRDLAKRIRAFQFRDIRPKAASEIESLDDASKLLGHTDLGITKRVYRRAGEVVKPTK
ncbi:tyrosine-type recombinase/integrase [Duganella aquatilis]|nr:tyrosine-type recombinase/integrase [Duganella aquatilis]